MSIESEINACREIQSWSPGSTRSAWVGHLERIVAAETDDQRAAATADAIAEARRLAEIVARIKVDADLIRQRITRDLTVDQDDEIADMTLSELVSWMRHNGIFVDDATAGHRDGWVIDREKAAAYASCRSWTDDCDCVSIDLLTGTSAR